MKVKILMGIFCNCMNVLGLGKTIRDMYAEETEAVDTPPQSCRWRQVHRSSAFPSHCEEDFCSGAFSQIICLPPVLWLITIQLFVQRYDLPILKCCWSCVWLHNHRYKGSGGGNWSHGFEVLLLMVIKEKGCCQLVLIADCWRWSSGSNCIGMSRDPVLRV